MNAKSDVNDNFNFFQSKTGNSAILELWILPIAAVFALTFVHIIMNVSAATPLHIILSVVSLLVLLIVIYKYRKAAKEDSRNLQVFIETVSAHVKNRYGITIIERLHEYSTLKNRVMAERANGEKIMIDLKPVDNGRDLMVFDGSKELPRTNESTVG